jgi:hypothetical protein
MYTFLNRENAMPMRLAGLCEVHRKPADPEFTRQFYTMSGNLTGVGNDCSDPRRGEQTLGLGLPTICFGPDLRTARHQGARNARRRGCLPRHAEERVCLRLAAGRRSQHTSHGVRIFLNLPTRWRRRKGGGRRCPLRPMIEHARRPARCLISSRSEEV